MKDTLPYFSHDNNASQHPKMKALISEYGFEGYGRFWILNEKIARNSGAYIDISRKVYKLDLANELGMNGVELDKFLNFLSDPEIDLINIKENKISTDRITELHAKIIEKRKSRRKDGQNGEKEKMNGHIDETDIQNAETDEHFDTEENKTEKKKGKENTGESTESPSSVSDNTPKPENDMTEPVELADLLLTSHRKEFPDYLSGKDTKKITEKWAQDIEKLIRIDKKPPETIRQVILWVKEPGNFWFQNIESGNKLREKFERLHGEMLTKKTDPPERVSGIHGNRWIPSAEESDRLIAEMNRAKERRIENGDLSGELKKIVREIGIR